MLLSTRTINAARMTAEPDSVDFDPVLRTAGIGASRSLPDDLAKVPYPSPQPPVSLGGQEPLFMSSRPEDSHLRALPDPYVNLSIHTAPDVRPFP